MCIRDRLRTKHKNGEAYYGLLYYSFLSPQQLKNVEEIIETLRPHIRSTRPVSYTHLDVYKRQPTTAAAP